MATRTAPDATGAATTRLMTFKWMDVSGDTWTEAVYIPSDATAAEIEALADAAQAGSNASLYEIDVQSVWGGIETAEQENADNESKSASVFDRLTVTAKHKTNPDIKDKRFSIPAPKFPLFINNFADTDPAPPTIVSDSILPTSTEFAAFGTTFLALLNATNYNLVWARYHDKGDLNERVPL